MKKLSSLLPIGAIVLLTTTGCQKSYHPVASLDQPLITCEELGDGMVTYLTSNEAVRLLDDEYRPMGPQTPCWRHAVQFAFDQDLDLPPRIIKQALKEFDAEKDATLFYQAANRYLLIIAQGEKQYTRQDRDFLTAYAEYIIHQATNAQDRQLSNIRQLCRNIDPDLYARLFQ